MEVAHRREELGWISGLNFEVRSFGCRNTKTQLVEVELPTSDWSVLFLLAPMEHGLHLWRIYQAFDDSLHKYFSPYTPTGFDPQLGDKLERLLKQLGISKRSMHSYKCFGILPRLWGERFLPKRLVGGVDNRLNSVLVPTAFASSAVEYFLELVEEFREDCITPAPEGLRLYVDLRAMAADGGLLLGVQSQMSKTELEITENALDEILASQVRLTQYLSTVDPAIKIAGAVRAPFLADLVKGREETCRNIAWKRLQLVAKAGWPHALERVVQEIRDDNEKRLDSACLSWLAEELAKYKAIHKDPLQHA